MSRRRPSKADRVLEKAKKAIDAVDDALAREPGPEEVAAFADKLESEHFARWHSEDSVLTALDNMEAKAASASTSARARRGTTIKKTQFLVWAIDATFANSRNGGRRRAIAPKHGASNRLLQSSSETRR